MATSLPYSMLPLWVNGLPGGQHRDELLQPAGTRFGLLRVLQSIEDGIAIHPIEREEELQGPRVAVEGLLEVIRNLHVALALVGSVPAAVCPGAFDLPQ